MITEPPSRPATRPRPSALRRFRAHLPFDRQTLRHAFSRDGITSFFKTLAWVVPLTALIWAYADREQFVKDVQVQFTIDVRNPDPNRTALLVEPRDRKITVNLSGPNRRVNELRELLISGQVGNGGVDKGGVQIDIDPTQPLGENPLVTSILVGEVPSFRDRGVIVSNVSPPLIRVLVDELVDATFVVAPTPDVASMLEGTPTFVPDTITLKLPRSDLENDKKLDAQGRRLIYADFSSLPATRQPGLHENVETVLQRPTEHATATLPKVSASFRVKQLDVAYTISAIPVFLVTPAGLLDRYTVTYKSTFTDLQVTGPSATIDMLKQQQIPVPKALLEINRDDTSDRLKGQARLRKPRFYDLPDGVTVSSTSRAQEVEFTVTDRIANE